MNKVILVGRLARDPEVRYTQSGKATASFSLAVARFANNEADFIPIVAWEKIAETVGNNLTKGSQILVEGRMQVRNYEDKNGQKRYVTEVIAQHIEFMGSKQQNDNNNQNNNQNFQNQNNNQSQNSFGNEVFPDEEIPF